MKTKAFRKEWCSYSCQAIVKPHQLLTKVPETIGFIGALKGVKIPSGKAYRSINVYRSMLSGTLEKIKGWDVGKHPLMCKLMQGILNSTPPKPKYTEFWDTGTVLTYIESLGPDSSLSFAALSKSLVVLLALTSFFRVSDIASIDVSSIVFSGPALKFSLSKLRKSQRPSSLGQVFSLKKLEVSSNICPVSCLEFYRKETQI